MADDTTTSAGTGATPVSDPQPATGNASGSATLPTKPQLTLEDVLKRNAELEHSHNNAKEELERHRKKLSAYEKKDQEAEAAKKAAQDAERSELERANTQLAEANQHIQHYKQQLVMAQVKLAAKEKGIIDADLAALAIKDSLELGEDGLPTNVDKALDTLIKNKPYLAPTKPDEQQQQQATPAQTANQLQAPAIPAMNPGRTNIQAPGTTAPGRIPQWSEVFKRP